MAKWYQFSGCRFQRRCLSGAHMSAKIRTKRRYILHNPMKDRNSIWIIRRYASLRDSTRTSSIDSSPGRIMCPRYLTDLVYNSHFLSVKLISTSSKTFHTSRARVRWSFKLLGMMKISCRFSKQRLQVNPTRGIWNARWTVVVAFLSPDGIPRKWNKPWWHKKAISPQFSILIWTCQ